MYSSCRSPTFHGNFSQLGRWSVEANEISRSMVAAARAMLFPEAVISTSDASLGKRSEGSRESSNFMFSSLKLRPFLGKSSNVYRHENRLRQIRLRPLHAGDPQSPLFLSIAQEPGDSVRANHISRELKVRDLTFVLASFDDAYRKYPLGVAEVQSNLANCDSAEVKSEINRNNSLSEFDRRFDAVVTCFFVDTASNVLNYIATIRSTLKYVNCAVCLT